MRWLMMCAAAFALGGCSTEPNTGTVRFTVDPTTCTSFVNPIAFDFYADLKPLGTAALAKGQSTTFSVAAGHHTYRAIRQPAVAQYDWTNAPDVEAGKTTDLTMTCAVITFPPIP